ncbi:NAD(P)/FAD-dependent oxidoreductase [Rhizobium halophilum]|uniref:NAD(P)/FAD-dependent oxidoreductase n=1 Tax=Rhizobium halophilum TaxID=2846852 RepID=UPI001EFDB160|nr:FAD-binding oxidoreductase [Rhizobium halophilum]MCF6371362.1 FAD-binding oxidoreductase [Rhizobium halophilum]
MPQYRPRVVVIGAGIIGSAIAYNLAIRQANVLLVDQEQVPGAGVTGKAFGWINAINGTPGTESYALWREGVAEYRRLMEALPAAFIQARFGSLLWKSDRADTERIARLHQEAGERVELLEKGGVQELEPRLRNAPDLAVFSPDDLALDPLQLSQDLVAASVEAGGLTRLGSAVTAIDTANGRVSAVRVGNETIVCDHVVMAAGGGVAALTSTFGVDTGLTTSPALLLRYACGRPVLNRILRGPRLEVRQAIDNTLLIAKSYNADTNDISPQFAGEKMLAVLKDELKLADGVELASAEIGERPVFADGLPRLGFLSEFSNLYLAVGHPGVILAPLMGRRAAEDVLEAATVAL